VVTVVVVVVAHCCDGGWARLLLRHVIRVHISKVQLQGRTSGLINKSPSNGYRTI